MSVHKVLVSGSRDWPRPISVHRALDIELTYAYAAGYSMLVGVGDCPTGADWEALVWGLEAEMAGHDIEFDVFKAKWKQYGRKAGPIRNAEMVNAHNYNIALIFNKDNSNGATNTRDLCMKKGIRTIEYLYTTDEGYWEGF